MAVATFNTPTGEAIAREMLVCYLNTGTSQSPVWSALGKRVADSSMELDWQRETSQDILGNAFSSMKKPIVTQAFEGYALESSDPAIVKLWDNGIKGQNVGAMASNDVLIVHLYEGTANTSVFAERYTETAIEISRLGGEGGGFLTMDFTCTYGGTRELGTASKSGSTVTFTKAT